MSVAEGGLTLYDTEGVAALYKVAVATVKLWSHKGLLVSSFPTPQKNFYSQDDLRAFGDRVRESRQAVVERAKALSKARTARLLAGNKPRK